MIRAQGSGMFTSPHTSSCILCCKCGILMLPNAANICANCLRSQTDITKDLQKHLTIAFCPQCSRFQQSPTTWIKAELESKELLTLCLSKLNLSSVRLVHAEFIWTEPHSKRIKIKLKVQREVIHGAILEQAHVVEFIVQDKLCQSCTRAQASLDQLEAAVQVRQRVSHRRTFLYLEQLILRHDAARDAIRIKQMEQGIDFFFVKDSHAKNFIDFVGKVAPIGRVIKAGKVMSHDSNSNSFSVEIIPICREDLICLPSKVSVSLGNLGPLVICTKVSNRIALLDPWTLRQGFLDGDQYSRWPFKALLSSTRLSDYIILDMEELPSTEKYGSKYSLAYAKVARVSDYGKNDRQFIVRTHLGNVLRCGDYALGYDLHCANVNDSELERYRGDVPDVVLIKKRYQRRRGRPRSWKLKSLKMEGGDGEEKMKSEYEEFLRDLEENPELRFDLSLYRDKEYEASMDEGEDAPCVPLEELLEDLDLGDEEEDDMTE